MPSRPYEVHGFKSELSTENVTKLLLNFSSVDCHSIVLFGSFTAKPNCLCHYVSNSKTLLRGAFFLFHKGDARVLGIRYTEGFKIGHTVFLR